MKGTKLGSLASIYNGLPCNEICVIKHSHFQKMIYLDENTTATYYRFFYVIHYPISRINDKIFSSVGLLGILKATVISSTLPASTSHGLCLLQIKLCFVRHVSDRQTFAQCTQEYHVEPSS